MKNLITEKESVLSAQNRLTKRKDFAKILKQGKGFKEGFLFLKVLKTEPGELRFGFVVSQKVSKKAVARNKIKRRLREIVRRRLKNIKKGTNGVFITLLGAQTQSFKELEGEVDKLFERAKIIEN